MSFAFCPATVLLRGYQQLAVQREKYEGKQILKIQPWPSSACHIEGVREGLGSFPGSGVVITRTSGSAQTTDSLHVGKRETSTL